MYTDYSQSFSNVFQNLDDCYPNKKRRLLIMFDDMIADIQSKKKLSPNFTELFLRGRKLNTSLIFISQSYFKVPKTIKQHINATHYFIMKILNKRELQKIA